jgi:hypothetical protein
MTEQCIHHQQTRTFRVVACVAMAVFCIANFPLHADEQRAIAKVKSLDGEVTIDPESKNSEFVAMTSKTLYRSLACGCSMLAERMFETMG